MTSRFERDSQSEQAQLTKYTPFEAISHIGYWFGVNYHSYFTSNLVLNCADLEDRMRASNLCPIFITQRERISDDPQVVEYEVYDQGSLGKKISQKRQSKPHEHRLHTKFFDIVPSRQTSTTDWGTFPVGWEVRMNADELLKQAQKKSKKQIGYQYDTVIGDSFAQLFSSNLADSLIYVSLFESLGLRMRPSIQRGMGAMALVENFLHTAGYFDKYGNINPLTLFFIDGFLQRFGIIIGRQNGDLCPSISNTKLIDPSMQPSNSWRAQYFPDQLKSEFYKAPLYELNRYSTTLLPGSRLLQKFYRTCMTNTFKRGPLVKYRPTEMIIG